MPYMAACAWATKGDYPPSEPHLRPPRAAARQWPRARPHDRRRQQRSGAPEEARRPPAPGTGWPPCWHAHHPWRIRTRLHINIPAFYCLLCAAMSMHVSHPGVCRRQSQSMMQRPAKCPPEHLMQLGPKPALRGCFPSQRRKCLVLLPSGSAPHPGV